MHNPAPPDWFPDWSVYPTVVVASGPSAKGPDYEMYRDRAKFIVVNDSWKLVPWADILLAADASWWNKYKGCPDFKGLKVTLDFNISRTYDVKLIKLDKLNRGITVKQSGVVGKGGNSGFYAINLAIQFGSKKIILSGFDMCLTNGMHWHGSHPKGLSNPREQTVDKWRSIIDSESKTFQKLGVEVINTSLLSALTSYPKISFEGALS